MTNFETIETTNYDHYWRDSEMFSSRAAAIKELETRGYVKTGSSTWSASGDKFEIDAVIKPFKTGKCVTVHFHGHDWWD